MTNKHLLSPPKPVVWAGKKYDSQTKLGRLLAEVLDCDPVIAHMWIAKGYRNASDVQRGKWEARGRQGPQRSVEWNGVAYSSIAAAARAVGISAAAMRYRIAKGYRSDDELKANAKTEGSPHARCWECNGEMPTDNSHRRYCGSECKRKAAFWRWKVNNPESYLAHRERMKQQQRQRRTNS